MVWVKKLILYIYDISHGMFPSVIDQNIYIYNPSERNVSMFDTSKVGTVGLRYVANLAVGLQNQVFAGKCFF